MDIGDRSQEVGDRIIQNCIIGLNDIKHASKKGCCKSATAPCISIPNS